MKKLLSILWVTSILFGISYTPLLETNTAQGSARPLPQEKTAITHNQDFDLGVHILFDPNLENMPGYLNAAANQLNLNWVTLQIRWALIEPEQGVYDWSQLDVFFDLVDEYDLNVMTNIATTPDWAREMTANLDMNGPPENYQDFSDFVYVLLKRYPDRIQAIEIWNEQNLDRMWQTTRGISPNDYVELATGVSEVVRFVDPQIIISGALAPTGVDFENIWNDFRYVDGMIDAGILDVVDCFGAQHSGYNSGPNVPWDQADDPTASFRGPFDNPHPSWSFYSTLTTYATKIQGAGSDVPLCVTEFGWATVEDLAGLPPGFEFAMDNSLQEHSEFTIEAIELMETWDFVWLAFIWNLNAGPILGFDSYHNNVPYSLIRPNYVPSPVWWSISEMNFRGREH